MKWFARVEDPDSGRIMEVGTTQPGVQFYTSNFLRDVKGKKGITYQKHGCLLPGNTAFSGFPQSPRFPYHCT